MENSKPIIVPLQNRNNTRIVKSESCYRIDSEGAGIENLYQLNTIAKVSNVLVLLK